MVIRVLVYCKVRYPKPKSRWYHKAGLGDIQREWLTREEAATKRAKGCAIEVAIGKCVPKGEPYLPDHLDLPIPSAPYTMVRFDDSLPLIRSDWP